jgi:hypothetical protein
MSETAAEAGTAPSATGPSTGGEPPFKGLEPFSERDAAFFFSRDAERDVILGSLMAARLLLLYGPSGVGKSSLVNAGLVHALREIARSNQEEGGVPELAVVVLDTWRDDPVRALKALLRGVAGEAVEAPALSPADEPSLRDALAAAAERVQGEVYVILDQFEEFFLYHGADERDGSFYREFPRAVNDPSLTVRFLVSLREDGLARLDLFKTAIPTLFANRYRLNYLNHTEAEKAIVGPVHAYNRLHPGAGIDVEPALVNEVLRDVQLGKFDFGETGQAGAGNEAEWIATPFLQLVMRQLWEKEMDLGSRTLRLDTLQNPPEAGLGGVKRIVGAHLDKKLSTLSEEDQDVAAGIFRYLVTRSGTKYAYSIASLADPDLTGLPEERIARVVNQLSQGDTRILSNIGPPPGATNAGLDRYQIFHDVLARAVLDWRLRHMGAREKEAIRRRELETRERERNAMAERARQLRRRYTGTVMVAVGAAVLAVYALVQRGAAERAKTEALAARDSANAAWAVADNAHRRADQQRDLYTALLDSVRTQNQGAFEQALGAIPASEAQVIAPVTASRPDRDSALVYIQFQGSITRAVMNELRQDLSAVGYKAPGVERIPAPFRNDVRYFYPGDEEAAHAVASRTEAFFSRLRCPIQLPVHRLTDPGAREGQVEVWVSHSCRPAPDSTAAGR